MKLNATYLSDIQREFQRFMDLKRYGTCLKIQCCMYHYTSTFSSNIIIGWHQHVGEEKIYWFKVQNFDSWLKFYVHWSLHLEAKSIIVQQDATIYSLLYFCKLIYMFRVVPPSIIRSTYNCNYSIVEEMERSSNSSTIAEGSRHGLTNARCCNYSYMCSWWWVEVPHETCRAVYRNIINCI